MLEQMANGESDRDVIAVWLKAVAKYAVCSRFRGAGGITTQHNVMVAVSMNTFDKLEEWAHENMARNKTTVPAERGKWHNLMFYGVPFTYDRMLKDDEVRIKEKP